ncbi:MAG: TlpA family protein disulfide reductase [Acidobacteria bacterium]|nr:TlpA family protein disulfide reductase [Acidobacteriota bacterium]
MFRHRAPLALAVAAALLAVNAGAAQIPRPSPEFAVQMVDGRQELLSKHRGKVVALAFLLTYCSHCQQTTKILSKLQNEYGPRGFQVLGSATEEMAVLAVPEFIKQFQPAFPVGFNQRNAVMEYLQHPPMYRMMMPQVVFVDRQGVIRAQHSGDDPFFNADQEKNIRSLVELLLAEKTRTAARRK